MTTRTRERNIPEPRKSVIQWLLESDPSIRWQVMRDLMDESEEVVTAERSRVASGEVHFDMEDGVGKPSRWNTLRALRVLDWHSGPRA